MTDSNWQLVFDASQNLGLRWVFAAMVGVGVAALVVVGGMGIQAARRDSPRDSRERRALGFLTIAMAMLTAFTAALWFQSAVVVADIGTDIDATPVVTGPVEHFHPMPFQGHDVESFDVAGVHFAYSDYEVTQGFNNTSSHGGLVREGLIVRIHYVRVGNESEHAATIARLEIRR